MKIQPNYDAAVDCRVRGIALYFARLPSLEIVALINRVLESPGIEVPKEYQNPCGMLHTEAVTFRPDPQRLYYWLEIPPVYEVSHVGRAIAVELQDTHGLTVRYQEFPPETDKTTIYKPVRTE